MLKRLLAILLMMVTCFSVIVATMKTPIDIEIPKFEVPQVSELQTVAKSIGEIFRDFVDSFSTIIPKLDVDTSKEPASSEIVGLYKVSYVIDGDTFLIEKDGERVKVRLIGVDTPESVASDEYLAKTGKQNVPEGKKASEFTTELLSGRSVYLEYDEQETDIYGRTLAYAYLNADKTEMVQELLLEAGMAKCMEVAPNTRYASYFKELEQTAKANNVGLWATDVWQ